MEVQIPHDKGKFGKWVDADKEIATGPVLKLL